MKRTTLFAAAILMTTQLHAASGEKASSGSGMEEDATSAGAGAPVAAQPPLPAPPPLARALPFPGALTRELAGELGNELAGQMVQEMVRRAMNAATLARHFSREFPVPGPLTRELSSAAGAGAPVAAQPPLPALLPPAPLPIARVLHLPRSFLSAELLSPGPFSPESCLGVFVGPDVDAEISPEELMVASPSPEQVEAYLKRLVKLLTLEENRRHYDFGVARPERIVMSQSEKDLMSRGFMIASRLYTADMSQPEKDRILFHLDAWKEEPAERAEIVDFLLQLTPNLSDRDRSDMLEQLHLAEGPANRTILTKLMLSLTRPGMKKYHLPYMISTIRKGLSTGGLHHLLAFRNVVEFEDVRNVINTLRADQSWVGKPEEDVWKLILKSLGVKDQKDFKDQVKKMPHLSFARRHHAIHAWAAARRRPSRVAVSAAQAASRASSSAAAAAAGAGAGAGMIAVAAAPVALLQAAPQSVADAAAPARGLMAVGAGGGGEPDRGAGSTVVADHVPDGSGASVGAKRARPEGLAPHALGAAAADGDDEDGPSSSKRARADAVGNSSADTEAQRAALRATAARARMAASASNASAAPSIRDGAAGTGASN